VGRQRNTEGPISLGDDDIIWFARGRLVVAVPRTATGGPRDAMLRITARHQQVGEKLAVAVIIKDDVAPPIEQVRKEIREAFEVVAPMAACTSVTILGSGFFASFFISFLGAVLAITHRQGKPQHIHTDLESAAAWMHKKLDDPETSLAEILKTLRWAETHVHESSEVSTSEERTGR